MYLVPLRRVSGQLWWHLGEEMPVNFQILPDRGLVYVRYEGATTTSDSIAAFQTYKSDPECQPGQNQLVDLSNVTGIEQEYGKLMCLQAMKTEVFAAGETETLIVYYAPNPIALKLAHILERPWEVVPGVVPIITQSEAETLSILGQRETSFDALLSQTA